MLVTFFVMLMIISIYQIGHQHPELVTNISNLSPTHLVCNIRHQHRCNRFLPIKKTVAICENVNIFLWKMILNLWVEITKWNNLMTSKDKKIMDTKIPFILKNKQWRKSSLRFTLVLEWVISMKHHMMSHHMLYTESYKMDWRNVLGTDPWTTGRICTNSEPNPYYMILYTTPSNLTFPVL